MSYWSEAQVAEFARDLRAEHGAAWDAFGPGIRGALIDQKVLVVALGQVRSFPLRAAIGELRAGLRAALT